MLRTLHLENFRTFEEFDMEGLARVNLLVGTNNCGKTSVLEAIHILSTPGAAGPLWDTLVRRGETYAEGKEFEADIAHLVHGHEIQAGCSFQISGQDDARHSLIARFGEHRPADGDAPYDDRQPSLFEDDDADPGVRLRLELEWRRGDRLLEILVWPLTSRGALRASRLQRSTIDPASPVHFIATDGLSRESVASLFDQSVLTDDEAIVLEALQYIEPGIERLASVGISGLYRPTRYGGIGPTMRGGIAMLLNGKRVPIGSMGDGIWRLLGIALALVRARGGILLVDEIDTGLHYRVLVDVWRLVLKTAERLDVQVFATTHSRDCYEALAAVAAPAEHREVSLQRIERDKPKAVAFNGGEMQQAAERGIEVR